MVARFLLSRPRNQPNILNDFVATLVIDCRKAKARKVNMPSSFIYAICFLGTGECSELLKSQNYETPTQCVQAKETEIKRYGGVVDNQVRVYGSCFRSDAAQIMVDGKFRLILPPNPITK